MPARATNSLPSALLLRLRKRLSLTQGQVATRAGFPSYLTVLKVEKGRNELSKAAQRDAFAAAYHLQLDEFAKLLSGKLSIAAAVKLFREREREREQKDRAQARAA